MANPLADAALEGLQIGREEGKQQAKIDKLSATRDWVNNWRRNNGVGPNVTPSKDVVPFKWMHPFLDRVQTEQSLQIGNIAHGTHRRDTGWAQFGHQGPEEEGSSPHKSVMPDGSLMYNDGSGNLTPWDQRPTDVSQNAPVWPGHKWPYPTPGQGPLPNPNFPQNVAQVDYGKPSALDLYFQKVGYPNRDMTPEQRLQIMRGAPKPA